MFCAASTAAAPQVTAECLKTRPPRRNRSARGWSIRAVAIVGLWVITVQARFFGSARATARAVVPPSRITEPPGRTSAAATAATFRLPSGATAWRAS
ncbi:hypothetical protein SGRI78S_02347 [Streptomyces griseus subsp. griseus]